MNNRTFYVRACWDDEAKVFYSESDIDGLHIEVETIEQFEEVMMDVAVELAVTNHIRPDELDSRPLRELVPGILWQRPEGKVACT